MGQMMKPEIVYIPGIFKVFRWNRLEEISHSIKSRWEQSRVLAGVKWSQSGMAREQ